MTSRVAADLDVARQFHTSANLEWGGFSLDERDRRLLSVRSAAAAAGFDGVLVPWGDGPNGGYLTQLDDAIVVLPVAERDPIVISDWGARSPWAPDARRTVDRSLVPHIVAAIKDAGLAEGRLGVTGLTGGTFTHVRTPDGVACFRVQEMIKAALPAADFVPATDLIGRSRFVKSMEEQACLAAAARIADTAAERVADVARPGVTRAVIRATLVESLFECGSEYRPQEIGSCVPGGHLTPWRPNIGNDVELIAGESIVLVVRAVWGGYTVQLDRTVLTGPVPTALSELIEQHAEVLDATMGAMRPGATLGEVVWSAVTAVRDGADASLAVVGAGLGDDAPFAMPDRGNVISAATLALTLEAANVFTIAPRIRSTAGDLRYQSGEVVVVNETGASRIAAALS